MSRSTSQSVRASASTQSLARFDLELPAVDPLRVVQLSSLCTQQRSVVNWGSGCQPLTIEKPATAANMCR